MVSRIPEFGVAVASADRIDVYNQILRASFPKDRVRATSHPHAPNICFVGEPLSSHFLSPQSTTLHVVEAPMVHNFSNGLLQTMSTFRESFPGELVQAVLVLRGHSYSRRLIPTAEGVYRSGFPDMGLDPTHHDLLGFETATKQLKTQTPWVHVVETDLSNYQAELRRVLESSLNGDLASVRSC